MRKAVTCMLALMALLVLLALAMPAPIAAAPTVPQDVGVYEEDFTAYTYKGYVEKAEWNIWSGQLGLSKMGTTQNNPSITNLGDATFVVAWVDYRSNDKGAIHAQRLDINGNRLWEQDVPIAPEVTTYQWEPILVTNNDDQVFIVWSDFRNGNWDIYVQSLDENGNKLWAQAVRANTDASSAEQRSPSLTPDGEGGIFVTWRDKRSGGWDIYVQRLDSYGNCLYIQDMRCNGSEGTVYQYALPDLTSDGSGGVFIAWEDEREGNTDVYLQRLMADGYPQWVEDVRVNPDSTQAWQGQPSLVYDGIEGVVVIWGDQRDDSYFMDIYAQRFDGTGNRLWFQDVAVNNTSHSAHRSSPPSATLPEENRIAVVWEDTRYGSDVFAQQLDLFGNRIWQADVRANSFVIDAFVEDPDLTQDGKGGILTVWVDTRDGNRNLYAQRLSSQGSRLWAKDGQIHTDTGTTFQNDPSLSASNSGGAFISWTDNRNGNRDIYAQCLDSYGNQLWIQDVRVNSDLGRDEQGGPAMAPDDAGGAFVVWTDNRDFSDIYLQRLDSEGNLKWTKEVKVNIGDIPTWPSYISIASDGNGGLFVGWADSRIEDVNVYLQRVDSEGNHVWTQDVQVNAGGGATVAKFPVLASDGNEGVFVVWWDTRSGNWDIYAQRLDANGQHLWSQDQQVNIEPGSTGEHYGDMLSTTPGGSGGVLVTWIDDHEGEWIVYAQRLSDNGNQLWLQDVQVSNEFCTATQYDVDVVSDGNGGAFIVWTGDCEGNTDVYMQRVTADGDKAWPEDIKVSTYSGTESRWAPAMSRSVSSDLFVAWQDYRNGGYDNQDIYAQCLDSSGIQQWSQDTQLVYPDSFYFLSGSVQSSNIDTSDDYIAEATLTAQYILQGGNVDFYLTNDGGQNWAEVTPGITHVFTTAGSDLRWRVEMASNPIWRDSAPIIEQLRIEYEITSADGDDYEPDNTCTQASPLQVNGAVQAHTFHQPDDEDWAWFGVVSGTTYVLQTAHAGPNADTVLELHDVCDHPILTDTNAFGHDARLLFTAPSDTTFYARVTNQDGSVCGEDTDYDLSVRTYHPNGLAVVVAGHNDAWQLQSNIDYAADQAYLTLLEAGFPRANVRYLGPNPNRDVDGNGLSDDIAATATITNVRYAIQDWPREQGLALGVPFYVYLMDHGHYDQFLANGSGGKVTAPLLNLWLGNLEATTGADQITVVIDACKSGSFIDVTGPGPAEISGLNRVIVASTTSQANAYPSVRGALFSDVFWTALGDNQDVWSAYRTAKAAVDARGLMQTPWLDDNGDAVANEEDGDLARGRGLAGVFGGSEPVIDWLTVGEIGAGGTATVAAQVRDDFGVMGVHVEVYPPGYEEPEVGPGETPVVGVPTATLQSLGGDVYTATLTGLDAPGFYRVVGYAVDDEGNWALPVWAMIHSGRAVYLPLVMRSD